jgi:hypothetical protein
MRLVNLIFPAFILLWSFTPLAARESMSVGDSTILIEWRGQFDEQQKLKLKLWLSSVTETVNLLNGSPPRPVIRVALKPVGGASAVPFARVLRDEPQGVLFYVNPDKTLDAYITDWTAYHEFAHLFIPYPGRADVWFSEGLASYYQNILQYRGGLLSNNQAIERLTGGFKRARKDNGHSDMTLGQLSAAMREKHAFMRVYWSGALYFLEADIELRRRASGNSPITNLDDLLREFGACCLEREQEREWNGMQIAAEFDQLLTEPLFVPLYTRFEQTKAIPDFQPVLEAAEMDDIFGPKAPANILTVQ